MLVIVTVSELCGSLLFQSLLKCAIPLKYLFKYCYPFEMGRIDNIINDFYSCALSLWTVSIT